MLKALPWSASTFTKPRIFNSVPICNFATY
jgi:hypothetical protein